MRFENILGHINVKNGLQTSLDNGKVSHAYIFCGKKGIGKTMVAHAFADALTDGSVADVTVVTNEKYDIKTVAFSVDAVRKARTEMYTRPYLANKRVFIFPQADTMTIGAQNALLKVFEEPPEYCVIILLAENENLLLQTIRSRAITVRFAPLPDEIVAEYLKQKYPNTNVDVVVKLAGGSILAADMLMSQDGLSEMLGEFIRLMRGISSPQRASAYAIINFLEREKANINVLFDVMLIMFRDTLLYNGEKSDTMAIANVRSGAVLKAIDFVEARRRSLSFNANFSIAISELLLNTWEAIHD